MFPLHERTRRRFCRWLFILTALLPTLGVVAWSASVSSTAHQSAVCQELQRRLGLDVRATRVWHPQPGITLFEGLELADPQTRETLVRMRLLEVEEIVEGRRLIVAAQPEIYVDHFGRFWPLIERAMARPADLEPRPLSFAAGELSLHWAGGVQTLTQVAARVDPDESGTVASVAFQTAGSSMEAPVELTIRRGITAGQPSTFFDLNTHYAALPCSVLAMLVGCENRLGHTSTLAGILSAAKTPDGWHTQFSGRLDNVDLQTAVGDRSAHRLSGLAQVTISHAHCTGRRIEHLEGTLRGGPGMINQSLVAAAARWLSMATPAALTDGEAESTAAIVNYSQLAFDFVVNSGGLKISGCCSGQPAGTALHSDAAVLLVTAGNTPVPLAALVNTLAPDGGLPVPATRRADWLLHMLPLPDSTPQDSRAIPAARLGHGPLRR